MSKKKSKLFMSLLSLAFCLGIMCFGVYAATSVSYTLSGHITYDVSDVFVDIETRHYLSTQTDMTTAKGEVASVMQNIATSLESGTTSIDGVTELASDYDKQSTLNNVGGEELPISGPALNITYGAYSNTSGEEKAYVHYIAILVTNYAEEEINAILNLDSLYDLTGSNSKIFVYRTMENIPAKSGETNGVMSYVFALGLDQPAQSADVDFSGVSLSVTRGNLDQFASKGLAYEYSEADGGYLVSDYTGTDTRVIIPSKYNDNGEYGEKNVVGIKSSAFYRCEDITSIRLPDGIISIGYRAFSICKSLVSISIPDSITTLDSTFNGCSSLTSIAIPINVASIDMSYAFKGCSSLTSIMVDPANSNFSNDENGVLFNKDKTTLILFPLGNTPTSYKIPDGVTTIGDYAFQSCSSLTSIEFPNSLTTIGGSAFNSCSSLTGIEFPNSLKNIGMFSFEGCISITSIEIPYSVTKIDLYAFNGCRGLTNIIVDPDNNNYSSDENGVLFNKNKTSLVLYPIGNTRTSYKIPDGVTSIGEAAFQGCTNLTSIEIPDTVKTIGLVVFSSCRNLSTVYIKSQDIVDKLTSRSSASNLIYYAENIYLLVGLSDTSATYLANNFTRQETTDVDEDGYILYTKN